MNTANIIAMLALFGFPQLLVRETASHKENNLEIAKLYSFSFRFTVKLLFFGIALFLLILFILKSSLKLNEFYTALLSSLLIPFIVLPTIQQSMLRGSGKVINSIWPIQIFQPMIFLFSLTLFYFYKFDLEAPSAFLLFISSYALTTLIYQFLFLRRFKALSILPKTSKKISNRHMSSLWSFFLIGGSNILLQRSDLLLVGVFLGFEYVAIYMIALQINGIVGMPLSVSNLAYEPKISELYTQGNFIKLKRLYREIQIMVGPISFIGLTLFCLFGFSFLSYVYGEEYSSSYWVIVILAFSQVISAFLGPAGSYLQMTKNENSVLTGLLLSLLLNILLNLILIPAYELIGAAVSTGISLIILKLYYIFKLKKIFKNELQMNNTNNLD